MAQYLLLLLCSDSFHEHTSRVFMCVCACARVWYDEIKKDIMEAENGNLRWEAEGVMNIGKDRAEFGVEGRGKPVGEKAH